MKSMKCDICDDSFEAEDFDGWFKQMFAHYNQDHADVMKGMEGKPKEEGERWMADAKAKFNAL